jgi:nitric oxide reductase subunit B
VQERYGGAGSDRARTRTIEDFQTNRYDSRTRTLRLTEAQAAAFDAIRSSYAEFFGEATGLAYSRAHESRLH